MRRLAPDLFALTGSHSMGFGMHFPVRMLAIRLETGIVLWSPIALDAEQQAAIDGLGEVRWIIAPNRFHHMHLKAAARRWPQAQLILPAGLAAKLKRPDLADAPSLATPPPSWRGVLEAHPIAGSTQMNEWALHHRPSRTLILCDLVFNMHHAKGWLSPLVFRMAGAWCRCNQSRLWRRFTDDRAAAGRSVQALLALDFDRLVMAHGEVIETGGGEALFAATTWMRGGAPTVA